MNEIKKIVGINLIILLVIIVIGGVTGLNESGQEQGLGAMILMALGIGTQTALLFGASLIQFLRRKTASGQAYLLASVLVLIVGFSACYGIASLF